MAVSYPSDRLKKVLLRIPEDMHAALEKSRKDSGRSSLTAEVLARLASTFPDEENWQAIAQNSPAMQLEKRVHSLETRVSELEAVLSPQHLENMPERPSASTLMVEQIRKRLKT
ncbi:TraY domain-containing protein [Hyphomicrobium sp. MC1]|uniref:TraY domain-containing protein n=1 Tax=Hyphomicrobium sp. (strain MC1) TaxID=717785 RepID=UPI000213EB19|nr:TraY domain-containing protein [Hyphomicrobium sp. MC1]CCB65380.1 protein of unknown function [Hyphomicrobium sp. MC1]